MLLAIQQRNGNIKTTHILYKSNLSYQMLEEYLNELVRGGFIVIHESRDRKKTYSLTDKGDRYLEKYRVITDFIDSFGLG